MLVSFCVLLWHPALALLTAPRAASPGLGARRTAPPARAVRPPLRMSTDSNPDSLEDVFEAILKVRLGWIESGGWWRHPFSSAASTLCAQESIKLGKSLERAKTKAAETSERLLQATTLWGRGCSKPCRRRRTALNTPTQPRSMRPSHRPVHGRRLVVTCSAQLNRGPRAPGLG